ncbi:MAG: hypothetical protein CDV28_10154 [Candidatus Electronema aureum]|uniref:Uncharacterized protein n=1 Tax=Candidatus Electronema aureum TaxID=2005002 RepID=A0A521G558_9BACT|nr:MAG: hypothetical protein CDV28_10154 [Candidatus Electronema aureum]
MQNGKKCGEPTLCGLVSFCVLPLDKKIYIDYIKSPNELTGRISYVVLQTDAGHDERV